MEQFLPQTAPSAAGTIDFTCPSCNVTLPVQVWSRLIFVDMYRFVHFFFVPGFFFFFFLCNAQIPRAEELGSTLDSLSLFPSII
jgi:hypothetical protein